MWASCVSQTRTAASSPFMLWLRPAIAADVLHRLSSLQQMTVLRRCAAVVPILTQTSVDGSHQPLLLSCCCFTCASSSGTMTTTQPLPAWAGLWDVFVAHQVSVIVRPLDY